jgi:hypothetical protein
MKITALILPFLFLFASGGNSQWITYNLSHEGVVYCMDFYNVNNGVACGHTLTAFNEKPYYTTNSGVNWVSAQCPTTIRAVSRVKFINASTLYATGAENLVLYNSGKISNEINLLPDFLKRDFIQLGRTGIITDYRGAFLKSTNAGISWQKVIQFDTLTGYLMDLNFFNLNTGYVIADSGSIGNSRVLKTINGGVNWQIIRIEQNLNLRRLLFVNENTGFVSGFKNYDSAIGGVLFRTTNAGVNWIKTNYKNGEEIKDISFSNSSTGFAICQGNYAFKVYKTVNAGNTWDSISYFQYVLSESICTVPGTGIVFITGTIDSSFYLKTFTAKSTDYGLNWTTKNYYWDDEILYSCLVDQNNWFMCGGNFNVSAVILKSTNGGSISVNNISSGIPDKYSLSQNYPNPFNPFTNIRFSIAENGKGKTENGIVSLKIFNSLGKEVAILVNEKLGAGEYEVKWDAADFPSGIYFYKLETSNFIQTKKMILIK